MTEADLPPDWLHLLRAASENPDGILSLADTADEAVDAIAERLTDLGLFRIVTARRYILTESGRAALGSRRKSRVGGPNRANSRQPAGWLRRLLRSP
ncbi:hypothetical protein [Paenirhodobacter populi]|uniref:hypothetical protein n=1 Tax=Paenirhodobacter populi TaxID=2306993 RepID=UPI001F4FB35E|nr:hypothetical protein [Sinirhodobacter populi]